MNEFLLLALAVVYLAITYGAGARTDRQSRYNEPSSHMASGTDASEILAIAESATDQASESA